MNLAQRLVGLTVLALTIGVIGFTNLPRNLGKDAVWGARYSAQHLHLVGGALLPEGGEVRISHIARDGQAQSQVVKVPAGQAQELAAIGITLPAPPLNTITEISLYSAGIELFRSVPTISGATDIIMQPVSLLRAMNKPYVCNSANGEDRVSLSMDLENHGLALHRESKGDGADLPSLFAVSPTQWESDSGQSLIVDADGSLRVLEQGTLLTCKTDSLWGEALPVHHIAENQYFYADLKTLVFFDANSIPVSMPVLRTLTETSWLPKDSKLTMWAESDIGTSTLTFSVETCATGDTWGLQKLKVVQEGPAGLIKQSCSGQALNPFPGTWVGLEWKGQKIGTQMSMVLTSTGFTVENPCAVYSGKLSHPLEKPFASATLQLANRRAKSGCTGDEGALDAELVKAFTKGVRLAPKGHDLTLQPLDAAIGDDPQLVMSRSENLDT